MQQFTVPQFIDVEDKIIGPITSRQFIILLFGAILIFICYKIFDFSAFAAFGLLIFAISGIIAFAKINGRPFHFFVLNLLQTLKRPNLRVWSRNISNSDIGIEEGAAISVKGDGNGMPPVGRYTTSRLAELALIADTRGIYRGEENNGASYIKTVENVE
ncbi:PrgI family protein [Patescibacteria group bacterium]|nr:PrgI family protein [Candidatus Falkowbacteria bacterium]MBU3905529.1 PrgI family protein [Patescibacteria group bacterium]MCG2697770.1 PrgI family protein [Candidatus Parcubacteria bacterium]MBU4015340.1 PrgI family protein [Patescibacteria group bacterium]MBU4026306.1 PrgI family protein [Patescibacteria group bacterium]